VTRVAHSKTDTAKTNQAQGDRSPWAFSFSDLSGTSKEHAR